MDRHGGRVTERADILATVRQAVRSVVEQTPQLRTQPALARSVAEKMVGVSMAAAELLAEEQRLTDDLCGRTPSSSAPVAQGLAAGDIHQQTAVRSAAGVLRGTRDAIDFPGFVTSLITGVFQSIQTSNIQQLQAFADLLEAVGSTTDDFAVTQITDSRAAQWAANRWNVFAVEVDGDEPRLVLRPGAEMPSREEIARVLLTEGDSSTSVDEDDLNGTLLVMVKRKLARDRQSMLSTMVLMGLQRVVVDDGHLHASMRLQVDARSTAEQTSAEQFDTRVETEASGQFGMGAWGASARMSASVGYVKSDEQYSREDIAVQAGLRSSVDLRFRTLPLDIGRMADARTLEGVRAGSMVPEVERDLAAGSPLEANPERRTSAPNRPQPLRQGELLERDAGTRDEARNAYETAQRSGNTGSSPSPSPSDTAQPDSANAEALGAFVSPSSMAARTTHPPPRAVRARRSEESRHR
jgi:hypothetical protein